MLPQEDEAEIEARFVAFEEELGAQGEVGKCLARRAALMSVRMDRAAEHEAASLSRKIRVAEELYDEERKTFVDELATGLFEAPATVVRRLRSMPEGIDWLIAAWKGVKADLMHPDRDSWHGRHWSRMENLLGRRHGDIPVSPAERLCQAAWGNFAMLGEGDGAGLAPEARRAWARDQLSVWIDAQVAELEGLRPTLDQSRAEVDRADAGRRALFDPSPQAILARKYEAAAERGFYRALRELKEMKELEARARSIEEEAMAIEAKATLGPFFPDPQSPIEAISLQAPGGPERPAPPADARPKAVPKRRRRRDRVVALASDVVKPALGDGPGRAGRRTPGSGPCRPGMVIGSGVL